MQSFAYTTHICQTALQIISTLKLALGDLDKVKKVVKLYGVVNSTNDFTRQAEVMNGCSDLFGEVFGREIGSHARYTTHSCI